jgi:hypothetical protein
MNDHDQNNLTLIDALITYIINALTPEERFGIADLKEHELKMLQLVMGKYMVYRIDQLNEQGNEQLLKECIERSDNESLYDADASVFISKMI